MTITFGLPEGCSLFIMCLVSLHDVLIELVVLVLVMVLIVFLGVCLFSGVRRGLVEGRALEIFWTLLPVGLILVFCFPAFQVLYVEEDRFSQACEDLYKGFVKGVQWDWDVSFFLNRGSYGGFSVDHYTLLFSSLSLERIRIYDVSNGVVMCSKDFSVFKFGSEDVVHSFAVPSLGVKVDCIPGKGVDVGFFFVVRGIFHGHCAEICGVGHSLIPVEVVRF
ncbi:MAG: cytochrome c oxidase subunit 2 [Ignavibacteria bacterium]|nr:MAG: cytochrome c oxidase subunit 2 [Ignavibacteria bacterium]